jgi:uncharacterized damage-inducible protein DinB
VKSVFFLALALGAAVSVQGQSQKPQTLKSTLLECLRTTHNQKDWFVPVSVAVEGVTADQAKWQDKSGNHSIGQLTNHLAFWNAQVLAKLKAEKPPAYGGNNEETFNSFDSKTWNETVKRLDTVLTELEKLVEAADENKLKQWASTIDHVATHNAYHTGQIVYIRRLQGSWDSSKGVK